MDHEQKIITIQISKNTILPDNFDTHSEKILQYGIEVHNNIEKIALLKNQSEKINALEEEYKQKLTKAQNEYIQLEDKTKHYESLIKEQKTLENSQINELIEKGRSQRDHEIEYLKNELKSKDDKLITLIESKQNQSIEDLNTKVIGLLQEIQSFNSYVGVSTAQKGSVGENIVFQYLSSHFPNYNVLDTSKNNASMSDLFMTSNDNKYQILVEVKNVAILSPTDKSKFMTDIEISSKNGKINGAILYSLHNANINSRTFNIVYHYGIPTLYISNVKNSVEMIKYGVFVMEELIQKNKYYTENMDNSEEHNDFIKMIDMINKNINYEFEMLEKDRKQIIFFENQYKERFKRTNEQMSYVKNLVEKYNVDVQVGKKQKTEKDDSNNNDAIVQSILSKITENNVNDITQMSLQKIGIKGSDISKAGGIKQIKTLLKTFVTKSEPIIIQNDS
jgi:hypothetical protein